MNKFKLIYLLLFSGFITHAQDSHDLWLQNLEPAKVQVQTKKSELLNMAKEELEKNWQGPAGASVKLTVQKNNLVQGDGFILTKNEIKANTEKGILYGAYAYLRKQAAGETITNEISNPSYALRILNHWDNLDASVERGYAGKSIFWRKDTLQVSEEDRRLWQEYARANASIGINGSVINNVNASPSVLKPEYLQRVKAVADELRKYGIQTYLAVNFASPSVIGDLDTADPLDPDVIAWWKNKTKEIYQLIPDFGGFLVKANSEGQPGPQDFGRNHADGANMLAKAVKSYDGIIMWRAFVYSPSEEDRAKQAYQEFVPLDGEFDDNVIIQVKNGPIDFQPREPFSPLFGAMKKTSVMPELQITQEYLGHSEHLVFLSTMWEEFLNLDTYQEGSGSTVARVTDGTLIDQKYTAIAGVSNVGNDKNWNGHLFAQSNWYAFGRLAWNNQLSSDQIANEWLQLTFGNNSASKNIADIEWRNNFLNPVKQMMLNSREAAVNYMMPLGLHHIMSANAHYGPGPWWQPEGMRKDWTPPYYHQADSTGLGFDRTASGSKAVTQYKEPLKSIYSDPKTTPDSYLLWFHHLPWDYKMKSGFTLWDELNFQYQNGLNEVREFQQIWDNAESYVEEEPFAAVQRKLRSQAENAQVWKDAAILYFQQFSKMPIPRQVESPIYNLDDLIREDQEAMRRRFRGD